MSVSFWPLMELFDDVKAKRDVLQSALDRGDLSLPDLAQFQIDLATSMMQLMLQLIAVSDG